MLCHHALEDISVDNCKMDDLDILAMKNQIELEKMEKTFKKGVIIITNNEMFSKIDEQIAMIQKEMNKLKFMIQRQKC